MKKWIVIVSVLCLWGVGSAQFSKLGTAGAQFLKIAPEPRGAALAGAFSAVADDPTALYWNPAGAALMARPGIVCSDVEWFGDIRNNFIGYVLPRGANAFGLSLTALTMGEEAVTTVKHPDGNGETFGASSIALGLSYARQFLPEFNFGLTIKLIQERIWDATATGFGFDFGTFLAPEVFGGLRGAFTISNFSPSDMTFHGGHLIEGVFREDWPVGQGPMDVELSSEPYSLPLAFKLGLAYDLLSTPSQGLTLAVDALHPNDGAEKVLAGLEYTLMNLLSLRVGYRYDPDIEKESEEYPFQEASDPALLLENFSFGGGISYKTEAVTFRVDYSTEDQGRLGLQHRFGVGMGF